MTSHTDFDKSPARTQLGGTTGNRDRLSAALLWAFALWALSLIVRAAQIVSHGRVQSTSAPAISDVPTPLGQPPHTYDEEPRTVPRRDYSTAVKTVVAGGLAAFCIAIALATYGAVEVPSATASQGSTPTGATPTTAPPTAPPSSGTADSAMIDGLQVGVYRFEYDAGWEAEVRKDPEIDLAPFNDYKTYNVRGGGNCYTSVRALREPQPVTGFSTGTGDAGEVVYLLVKEGKGLELAIFCDTAEQSQALFDTMANTAW